MKIYIDSDFKCHTTNPDDTYQEVETDFFDGKCQEFIEGYRFVPYDKVWTRHDGVEFSGEMISPWRNSSELGIAQSIYEKQLITEYREALKLLEVSV